jgi:hypothetical protein
VGSTAAAKSNEEWFTFAENATSWLLLIEFMTEESVEDDSDEFERSRRRGWHACGGGRHAVRLRAPGKGRCDESKGEAKAGEEMQ